MLLTDPFYTLRPSLTRQAKAILGPDATVETARRDDGDRLRVTHPSLPGGYTVVTLEQWMDLVAGRLEAARR